MALEDLTGSDKYISSLVNTNPLSADDRREGDDHIRGIKNVLKNTFPAVSGPISFANYVLKAGDTMTGPLTVPGPLKVTGAAGGVSFDNVDTVPGNNQIAFGWRADARLGLRVDGVQMGANWPINVTGSAASAAANVLKTGDIMSGMLTANGGVTVGTSFEFNAALGSRSVINNLRIASNRLYIGWNGPASMLDCQVDDSYFAADWPINIRGWAATAGNADTVDGLHATAFPTQDSCMSVGFASGSYAFPFLRHSDARVRRLCYGTNDDGSAQGFRLTGGLLEISGVSGVWGTPVSPCDVRLKDGIEPATVDASAAVAAMEFIAFDWKQGQAYAGLAGTGRVPVGYSAQNLQAIDPALVLAIEQPAGTPLADLGAVLNPNAAVLSAYLGKALQEALARIDALEQAVGASRAPV